MSLLVGFRNNKYQFCGLDDDEKGTHNVSTLGGEQSTHKVCRLNGQCDTNIVRTTSDGVCSAYPIDDQIR